MINLNITVQAADQADIIEHTEHQNMLGDDVNGYTTVKAALFGQHAPHGPLGSFGYGAPTSVFMPNIPTVPAFQMPTPTSATSFDSTRDAIFGTIGQLQGTIKTLYHMLAADDTPPTTHDTLRPAHPEQPVAQLPINTNLDDTASRNAFYVGSGNTIHVGFACSLNADAQLHLLLNGSPDTDDPGLVSPALGVLSNIAHVSPCNTSSASSFDVGNPHRRRLSRHQPAHRQLAVRSSPTARHAQLTNNSSPSAARQQLAIVRQLADSSPSAARQQLAIHNSPTACLSQPTRSL